MVYYASMIENLSKVEYASLLYDFYGQLLDDNKKDIMTLYHEDNLSLKEIAEDLGQSRQGVHYTLKKAEATLEKYEEKLGLVQKYLNNLPKYEQIEQIATKYEADASLDDGIRKDMNILINTIKDLME
jgi:uncharacterized protein